MRRSWGRHASMPPWSEVDSSVRTVVVSLPLEILQGCVILRTICDRFDSSIFGGDRARRIRHCAVRVTSLPLAVASARVITAPRPCRRSSKSVCQVGRRRAPRLCGAWRWVDQRTGRREEWSGVGRAEVRRVSAEVRHRGWFGQQPHPCCVVEVSDLVVNLLGGDSPRRPPGCARCLPRRRAAPCARGWWPTASSKW